MLVGRGHTYGLQNRMRLEKHGTKEDTKAIMKDVTRASIVQRSAADAPLTVPLYVTPAGLLADGELTDMYVKGDSLEIVFRNTGQLRTDIVGEIQVQTADSTVATTVTLDSTAVLVDATRHSRVEVPKLPRGQCVLVALVDFGGDHLTAVQAALDIRERANGVESHSRTLCFTLHVSRFTHDVSHAAFRFACRVLITFRDATFTLHR